MTFSDNEDDNELFFNMSEKTLGELFLAACFHGEEAKVNAAILLGVDVNIKGAEDAESPGESGLYMAMSMKHENVVDILLAHPAIDINGKCCSDGDFPLSVAAFHGLTSVVAKLGRMPALKRVNGQDSCGWTPLSMAASEGKGRPRLTERLFCIKFINLPLP